MTDKVKAEAVEFPRAFHGQEFHRADPALVEALKILGIECVLVGGVVTKLIARDKAPGGDVCPHCGKGSDK